MTEEIFLRYSAEDLTQLAGRIQECLGKLTADQVWLRHSENENAVGNLVLHLCGNVRQWIGFGVGKLDDVRNRDSEFAARGALPPAELSSRLKEIVEMAVKVVTQLPQARLTERTKIQGHDITVLEAIYHVVEHFAQHTGQIILLTKFFTGQDLGFYAHLKQAGPHGRKTP
ncbi:MAG: DinB family protein [Bryobacteraceae bacterium]